MATADVEGVTPQNEAASVQALQLHVFLASPGDVGDERSRAREVLQNLLYDPGLRGKISVELVAWDDTRAGTPMIATLTPQAAIAQGRLKPSQCDIVIVILWARMGTPLPPDWTKPDGSPYLSGTEWEYLDALAEAERSGKPTVLVYRRDQQPTFTPADLKKADSPLTQWERVESFFAAFRNPDGSLRRGVNKYKTVEEFRVSLDGHLKELLHAELKKREALLGSTPATAVEPIQLWQGSPFPGLRAFTPDDAPIFFGRGRETDELVRVLQDPAKRIVLITGASGSGKSSVVAAGLLPRLKENAAAGSKDWLLPWMQEVDAASGRKTWSGLRFTPGELSDNPFEALAARLAPLLPSGEGPPRKLAEALRAQSDALPRLIARALADKPHWTEVVMFADQFEELLTISAPEHQGPFIGLIAAAVRASRLRVIAAMRADFYPQLIERHPEVADSLNEYGVSVPLAAPRVGALYEMIAGPAGRAGLDFEDGLVQRMLDDAGSEPGALALIAFALHEIYQRKQHDGRLTHAAYDAFGGVRGAISQRAEATYEALPADVQGRLSAVFRELVEVDERGVGTRRRVARASLAASAEARQLIDSFVDARLLVNDRDVESGGVIEVAHEALLREWPRLADWIRQRTDDLRLWSAVRRAAREWDAHGRRKDFLWSHERLQPVEALVRDFGVPLDDLVSDFIRPEHERLFDELRQPDMPDHRVQSILDRLVEIGEPAVPLLVRALGFVSHMNYSQQDLADHLRSFAPLVRQAAAAGPMWREPEPLGGLRAFGFLASNDDIPTLCRALLDRQERVREEAVLALGRIDTAEGRAALVEALRNPHSDVRRTAFQRFRWSSAPPGFAAALAALITEESDDMRAEILEYLERRAAYIEPMLDFVPVLVRALADPRPELAERARTRLASIEDKRAAPALLACLQDCAGVQRAFVVYLIGRLGDRSVGARLIPLLHDSSAEVRAVAPGALASLGVKESCEELLPLLDDPSPIVQAEAAASSGVLGCTGASERLLPLLTHPNPRVRGGAAQGIGMLQEPRAAPQLFALLSDAESQVRERAALALGRVKHYAATGRLAALCVDPSAAVRRAAVEALMLLESVPADTAGKLLADEDASVRAQATRAFAEVKGDASVIPRVTEMLADREGIVRASAIQTLAAISGRSAARSIVQRLADVSESVRKEAQAALEKLGSFEIAADLAALLRSGDTDVRARVLRLLDRFGDASVAGGVVPLLGARDWNIRHAASHLLKKVADDSVVRVLVEALEDGDGTVRVGSADLLGEIGSPLALDGLGKALATPDTELRCAAVKALGMIGDASDAERMFPLLGDGAPAVRAAAASALAALAEKARKSAASPAQESAASSGPLTPEPPAEWGERVLPLMNDPEATVRASAFGAAGVLRVRKALPLVREAAAHGAADLRPAAIRALGAIGDPGDVESLLACLDDGDEAVASAASAALGELRDPRAVDALRRKSDEAAGEVRYAAIAALGAIGAAPAIPGLLRHARSEEFREKHAAIDALGKMSLDRPVPEVRAAVLEGNPEVRAAAIALLATTGAVECIPDILDAAGAEDWRVRQAALDSFKHYRSSGAVGALGALIPSSDASHRGLIARALARTEHPHAVAPLKKLFADQSPEVRAEAINALGSVGDESILPLLLEAAGDSDYSIRHAVVAALQRLGAGGRAKALVSQLGIAKGAARACIMDALAVLGDSGVTEDVFGCAGDADAEVRASVARYVARVEGLAMLPRLLELARDADYSVSYAAVRGISEIKDKESLIDKLRAHIASGEPPVRKAIAAVLAQLEETRAMLMLIGLARDPDSNTRRAAIEGLGKFKDERAVHASFEALGDEDVRWSAAGALGNVDPQQFRDQFEHALIHLDYGVCRAAASVLADRGDQKEIPILQDLLVTANQLVVDKASRTLESLNGPRLLRALLAAHDKPLLWDRLERAVRIKLEPERLVEETAALLEGAEAPERAAAARLLGGVPIAPALAVLERLSKDADGAVREAAEVARQRIGELSPPPAPEVETPVHQEPARSPGAMGWLVRLFKRP